MITVCSSWHDAIQLGEFLDVGEVFRAWFVWSGAAETALADASQFCGSAIRAIGLVRGSALVRVVRLGGHKVRTARGNAADAHDAADVSFYRDSSIAPLLDMKRGFIAVMDVFDAMIRHGSLFLDWLSSLLSRMNFLLWDLFTLLLWMTSMLLRIQVLGIFIVWSEVFIIVSVISFMRWLCTVERKPSKVA